MDSLYREWHAEDEPENPVDPEVVSVDRVGPDGVADAFNTHEGHESRLKDLKYEGAIETAVESGSWVAFRATYRTYIPMVWMKDHHLGGHGSDSVKHRFLKVIAAQFLDRAGHEMPTYENKRYEGISEHNREWIYEASYFEVRYGTRVADVVCSCDRHTAHAEVGNTPAKRWFTATTEGVDTLVVIPYRQTDLDGRGVEVPVYLFHRGDESWGRPEMLRELGESVRISTFARPNDYELSDGESIGRVDAGTVAELRGYTRQGGTVVVDEPVYLDQERYGYVLDPESMDDVEVTSYGTFG